MEALSLAEIGGRTVLAALAGLAVGWERERHKKPAGLRPHLMVSLGACAFAMMDVELVASGLPGVDPTRIVQGLIGGIGFLGAGAIIQSRGNVRGITTASTLWLAAAMGMGVGLGFYAIAGVMVAAALIVLLVIGPFRHEIAHVDEEVASKVESGTQPPEAPRSRGGNGTDNGG